MLIKCVYVRQANHHNLSVVNGGICVAKPIPCFNGSYYIKVDGNEYIVKTIGEALMIKSLGVIMAKFEIVRNSTNC